MRIADSRSAWNKSDQDVSLDKMSSSKEKFGLETVELSS
jgi:hypothetical protein